MDQQRGASVGNGNSFANGPETPKWARNAEFMLLREMQVTIWSLME